MEFRVINNPVRVSQDFLKRLSDTSKPGEWIAQEKFDGWRRPAYKINGAWHFQSKTSGGEEGTTPLPPDLTRELSTLFGDVDNLAIDMEWIGRRCKDDLRVIYGAGYNGFRIFDLLFLEGQWQGATPLSQRLASLRTIYEVARSKNPAPRIELVESFDSGWDKLFEESKKNPLAEGVVLKKATSKLVPRDDNPLWIKIKHRNIHEATKY